MKVYNIAKQNKDNVLVVINNISEFIEWIGQNTFVIPDDTLGEQIAKAIDTNILWHDKHPNGGFAFGANAKNIVIYEEEQALVISSREIEISLQDVSKEQLLNCDGEKVEYMRVSTKSLFDLLSAMVNYNEDRKYEFQTHISDFDLPDELKEHLSNIYKF